MYNLTTTRGMDKERFVSLWLANSNSYKGAESFEEKVDKICYDEFMEEAKYSLDEAEVVNTVVSEYLDNVKSNLNQEDLTVEKNIEKSSAENKLEQIEEIEQEIVDSSINLSEELLVEVETLLNSDIEILNDDDSMFTLNIDYPDVEDDYEYNGFKLTSKIIRGKKGFQMTFSLNDLEYYSVDEENLALI